MKIVRFLAFALVFCLLGCVRMDESMQLFFPKELKELQFVQTEFPAFWWNFVIIEPVDNSTDPDFKTANELCVHLKKHIDFELRMVFCGTGTASAGRLLKSWAEDYVLRVPFQPNQENDYQSLLASAAVQTSFMTDASLFKIFRSDPFQTWQSYLELSKNPLINSFEKRQGYLYDIQTSRLIIPVQFQLAPQLEKTRPIMDILKPYSNSFLIGSHGSTYRNEKQVRDDVAVVSVIGSVVLIFFIIFLVLKSRLNTLFLLVPVSIAMYVAAIGTQLIDGSVHGLTLAFGSGIVGLTLDYGLHGAFGSESKQTWTSNVIGLLTTLCGVGILLLSGIPLIRQMMTFSIIGLAVGFALFFVMFKYFAGSLKMKSVHFVLPQIKGLPYVVAVLVAIGLYGAYRAQLTMDLRKLSFVSKKESDLTTWFFSKNGGEESFLLIKPIANVVQNSATPDDLEYAWAQNNQITYDGFSKYLPSVEMQKVNLSSWTGGGCDFFKTKTTPAIQKIYEPFIRVLCQPGYKGSALKEKYYLNHLIGETHALSIFNAQNKQQAAKVKAAYPQAMSLSQALQDFSNSLEKDLRWMIPLSLVLTLIILGLYYRRLKSVLSALLPFATGLGLYFAVSALLSLEVNLISILGLVMVFGFSIDYGVFSTDAHLHAETEGEVQGVYSALTFAALTNILGFLPMLFAGHPVLVNLGSALFYGTLGTYLGTVYGVYPLYQKSRKVAA
ncbi:MAG: MMPL family transporter [Bdellovibrionaceae bacterium]|nr:MMPL family transporter [Bdellovibrio sp.]